MDFSLLPVFLAQAAPAGPGIVPAPSLTLAPETVGLFTILQKGGLLMWPIVACSVIAIGVFAERMIYYRRCQINVSEFLLGIANLLRRGSYAEALERSEEGFGPVVRVVRQTILARDLPPAELREVAREIATLQIPRLEAHLGIIASVAQIAPLLGFLGTVSGMIEAFLEINRGGTSVSDLASGIWTSLITTAAGLMIAIPAYVAYNFLVARMNSIIADVERAGIETVHGLTRVGTATVPAPDNLPVAPRPEAKPASKAEPRPEAKPEPKPKPKAGDKSFPDKVSPDKGPDVSL
jgi:biopolymer transport protein ExbB